MNCAFCSIINNANLHHQILWSNETHVVLLDIAPIEKGHVLVIPRAHVDYVFDMASAAYGELLKVTKEVAKKLKQATGKKRIVMAVGGFHVPHVHIHLIPTDRSLNVLARGTEQSEESFRTTAEALRKEFEN